MILKVISFMYFEMQFFSIRIIYLFLLGSIPFFSSGQTDVKNAELIQSFISQLTLANKLNLKKANNNIKIFFIQVNRDSLNLPSFISHEYEGIPGGYYYPASLVKLPVLLMALEKIHELEFKGIDKSSCYETKNIGNCLYYTENKKNIPEGCFSIENDIKKILIASNNVAYNNLHNFLGYSDIVEGLKKKGYDNVFIPKKFIKCSLEDNRISNPFWFYDSYGKVIYHQPSAEFIGDMTPEIDPVFVGKTYHDNNNRMINEPKDFSETNYLKIEDALKMLVKFIFPEVNDTEAVWDISDNDRLFILKYLSMFPRQSDYKEYKDSIKYPDNYKKVLIYGNEYWLDSDESLKIFNLNGLSYGFISDVAYVVDFKTGTEFFLAISMYANINEELDGNYNYTDIALPIFGDLGRIILNHEKYRLKQNLTKFTEINKALTGD